MAYAVMTYTQGTSFGPILFLVLCVVLAHGNISRIFAPGQQNSAKVHGMSGRRHRPTRAARVLVTKVCHGPTRSNKSAAKEWVGNSSQAKASIGSKRSEVQSCLHLEIQCGMLNCERERCIYIFCDGGEDAPHWGMGTWKRVLAHVAAHHDIGL